MPKGRRAADRRREREQAHGEDPNAQTREVTSVSPGPFDARAETVLNAGEAPKASRAGLDGDLSEDTRGVGREAERTVIREAPDKPQLCGGRLKALRGADAGLDVIVDVSPAIVGRKGDVKLTDPTVSREHIELEYVAEDRAWVIEDLGSTSGTLLNGEPLTMPTEVKHGDVIALGQTELRFSWAERLPEDKPEAEPEPEPPKERTRTGFRLRREDERTQTKTMPKRPEDELAAKKQRRAFGVVAAVIAVILVAGTGVAGYLLFFHGREDPAQVQAQVKTLLDDARRLTEEGALDDAKERLVAVLALVPKQAEAESLLKMLDSDVEAASALAEARRFFEEGKVEEALRVLQRIPDSSRFAKGRDELRAQVEERARKRALRSIEKHIDDGDLDGAAALLEDHLARWPKDTFANAMRDRIAKIRAAPPPEHPAVARARDAFQKGEAMEARLLVEQEAKAGGVAARYLADLDTFENGVAAGKALLRKKDKRAVAELDRAYKLLPRLGRLSSGPKAEPLKKLLADALFLEGISAKRAGDECGWAASVRRAAALAPKDSKISGQMRQVDQQARAALTRAEARAGHDKAGARRIAEAGVCLAGDGTPTRRALKSLTR